jgi:SAM-dependent methyltransferase
MAEGKLATTAEQWDNIHRAKKASFYWNVSATRDDVNFFRKHGVKDILDVGCGNGKEARFFVDHSFHVKGIDLSPFAVKEANEKDWRKDGPHFQVTDLNKHGIPFPDKSFDAVFSAGVLEHTNLARSFKEVSRVLKPGGVARVSMKLAIGEDAFYPADEILAHIKNAGLEHVKQHSFDQFDRPQGKMSVIFFNLRKPKAARK